MDFDPYSSTWRAVVPRLELLEMCWQAKSRTGRVLSCGIYRTDAGLETRVGYGEDLLRSQFARELGDARNWADEWKSMAREKGFGELTATDIER